MSNFKTSRLFFILLFLIASGKSSMAQQTLQPNWPSLEKHNEVPEWMREGRS